MRISLLSWRTLVGVRRRLLFLLTSVALAAPNSFTLAAGLTEREAVRAALERTAYRAREAGSLSVAETEVVEASKWPNPVLAIEREHASLAAGTSTELSARLSQSFDISGRRAFQSRAAGSRADAARFDVRHARSELVARVRSTFTEALYREQLRLVHEDWLAQLEQAEKRAVKLVRAGEASGYDQRRIQREADTARARVAAEKADVRKVREVLAGALDLPSSALGELAGELLPSTLPAVDPMLENARTRGDLASLLKQAEAFEQEERGHARGWIPDVTLGVGAKRIHEQGVSDTSLILGLSVPLPVFDRAQPARQRARAHANTLRADYALALTQAQAELRGVWLQARDLQLAAQQFQHAGLHQSRELSRIAETAYRGGEGGVLELLDAYRAELDAQLTSIELSFRARLARIELDRIAGSLGDE